MARIHQWIHHDRLSYLLFEPISRRSALIDPLLDLESQYHSVLGSKGLTNLYQLHTHETDANDFSGLDLPGNRVDARNIGSELTLGETRIQILTCGCGSHRAFICDGLVFSGEWWLPFDLRSDEARSMRNLKLTRDHSTAQNGGARSDFNARQPLVDLPRDYVLYPGKAVNGIRISSIAQECAWSDKRESAHV